MSSQINPWISLSVLLKHKYFSSQDLNTIAGVVSKVIKFLIFVYENIKNYCGLIIIIITILVIIVTKADEDKETAWSQIVESLSSLYKVYGKDDLQVIYACWLGFISL